MPPACRECRRPVRWALTGAGKRMPLDPEPDENGNQAAYRDGTGGWRTRQLRDGQEPYGWEKRYMPHFATCPGLREQQPRHLAPAPAAWPPNVIPISRARRKRRGPLDSPVRPRGA